MGKSDHYKTAWASTAKKIDRSWGHELEIGALGTVRAKSLHLDKGKSTSLKYYTQKNEVLFIRDGEVIVEYDSEKYHWQDLGERTLKSRTLVAGDVFFVQSNCPYRLTALQKSEIFEIGDKTNNRCIKIDEQEET